MKPQIIIEIKKEHKIEHSRILTELLNGWIQT